MTMLFVHNAMVTARAGSANTANPQAQIATHTTVCILLKNMSNLIAVSCLTNHPPSMGEQLERRASPRLGARN